MISLCGQDVGLTQYVVSEESDSIKKLEQDDQQQDGQTVSAPVAEASSTGSKVMKAQTHFGRIRFCQKTMLV